MRSLRLLGYVALGLTVLLFPYVTGLADDPSGLQSILSEEEYVLSGLDKLTGEEQELLFSLLCIPRQDFLVETALRRMEADSWRPVEVIGYGTRNQETSSPERYLVVVHNSGAHRFQVPISSEELAPGRYWAKTYTHVWTLLRPDGSTDNLWPLSDD